MCWYMILVSLFLSYFALSVGPSVHPRLCIWLNSVPFLWLSDILLYIGIVTSLSHSSPAIWETWVRSLGWEDPLKKGKATHSSVLPIPEFHGLYSPWGCKESDPTEWLARALSVDGHLGCLHVLQWTLGCMCLFEIWFSRGICPVVRLLKHMDTQQVK